MDKIIKRLSAKPIDIAELKKEILAATDRGVKLIDIAAECQKANLLMTVEFEFQTIH